ncbi:hypothetical protein VTI74DRAFT_3084 [Chaetomium olivicolor]
MPSKTGSKPAEPATRGKPSSNFVDDYLADWEDDDPFRSPSPPLANKNGANDKENKKDTLGIDKELDLKKRPRAPRVKLDETRLLSDKGIPKLRKMAPKIKFKGKGHEFDDARRLLSFYQEWLDDLFPKATFLDALAMVEKTGHKTTMRNARLKWIDEGKPRAAAEEGEEEYRIHSGSPALRQPDRTAPIFEKNTQERAKTPAVDDLFGDDNIYNATPRQNTGGTAPSRQVADDDVPDEDDLDALMAEAEAVSGGKTQQSGPGSAPFQSIFGDETRERAPAPAPNGEPDDDDLDALMAEAEAQSGTARPSQLPVGGSIFGGPQAKQPTTQTATDDEDDLDALMAEAEAQTPASAQPAARDVGPDDDDLDALMVEAEADAIAGTHHSINAKASSAAKGNGQQTASFEDDEEVMAEMDGLW